MKRHALVVGINHYEDDAINDLRGAEQDAVDLYGILRDRLDFDDARYLSAPDQQTVLDAVEALSAGLGPGDQFLFFFAGHGVLHEGEQHLLMPQVRYHRIRHGAGTVSVGALRDETAGRGLNRLFILDCCRSNLHAGQRDALQTTFDGGVILRDLVARARRPAAAAGEESLSILCSCEDGQQAAEIPGGQGLFTTALANRLRASGRQGTRLDDAFVAALGSDMNALAHRHGLAIAQHPLWLPAAAVPVLGVPFDGAVDVDARLWARAQRDGTVEAYRAYLRLCEACTHRPEAETAIEKLVEAAPVAQRVQKAADLRLKHPLGYAKLDTQSRELPDDAAAWAMVLDVKTGLMWEHKTDDGGVRDKNNTFSWYDPSQPRGFFGLTSGKQGKRNGGKCTGGIDCDTQGYVDAVNRMKLGGYADWRMPTIEELKTLIAEDQPWGWNLRPEFFADRPDFEKYPRFWSASVSAYFPGYAWVVYFYDGNDNWSRRSAGLLVRLVREGQ